MGAIIMSLRVTHSVVLLVAVAGRPACLSYFVLPLAWETFFWSRQEDTQKQR